MVGRLRMRYVPAMRRPQEGGFTLIELLGVLVIIGIAAGISVYRVNHWRYRMDANARLVQNFILSAQQVAVRRNVQVQVMVDAYNHRLRLLKDYNGDEQMDAADTVQFRSLMDGALFIAPARTLDGAQAAVLTGPGARENGNALQRAFLIAPTGMLLAANGRGSGDVVIYLGSPRGLDADARAVAVTGATGRPVFFSNAGGTWRRVD